MAVILYSNGITEEYRPSKLVFTEEEIVKLFDQFSEVGTCRLVSVLNTWCVYGRDTDPMEFNRIASDITQEAIYSHVLFIHDSEINEKWKATDSILYKDYKEFLITLKREIDITASDIVNEYQAVAEDTGKMDVLPQLVTLGATKDKRLLFSFNPEDQSNSFYGNEEFGVFSQKVFDYITKNKPKREPFTIYADNKAIIIIESQNVKKFLNSMIEKFKSIENYEACTQLSNIKDNWVKTVEAPKAKKTRKPRVKKEQDRGLDEK